MATDPIYDYEFCVWPDSQSPRWTLAVFDLFRLMQRRVVVDFTESKFNDYREELAKCGINLVEISRTPHHIPETVL